MTRIDRPLTPQCAISGGGPAGLVLGALLARAGVEVVVLEKHADFLRDFRGDTIHPSTLRILDRLGWLDEFLTLPHHKFRQMNFTVDGKLVPVVDFASLGARTGFVAMMPQWDFLDFIARKAAAYPGFRLLMQTEATGLIEEGGRVVGLRAGDRDIRADLVVAADGRHSALRAASGLALRDLGSPIDVLWFRIERTETETAESLGRLSGGRIYVQLNRGSYWQMACVVPKDSFDALRAGGIGAFRAEVGRATGIEAARLDSLSGWEDVKLLKVQVNRLERWWREGLLCIGDAAHAMSPVGGVGINLAVQDAVAAANLLAAPLREGRLGGADLAAVQQRRLWPTRVTQRVQRLIQERGIQPRLGRPEAGLPLPLRLLARFPWLRRFPARFIGLGLRRELPQDVPPR